MFDATNAQNTPPSVKPIEEQEERESQRLWQHVVKALHDRDQERATEEKFKIENRQREEARMRETDDVEWHPRYFRRVDPSKGEEEGLDYILAAHMFVTLRNDDSGYTNIIIEMTLPSRKNKSSRFLL